MNEDYDRHILKLSHESLMIEDKTLRLFDSLLNTDEYGRLSNVYKSIQYKNKLLEELRQSNSILSKKLHAQDRQQKPQENQKELEQRREVRQGLKMDQQFSIYKMSTDIQRNHQKAREFATKADRKQNEFTIFLIRSIWDAIHQKQFIKAMKVVERESIMSTVENNFDEQYRSIQQLKNNLQAHDEQLFGQIIKKFGLRDRWDSYIDRQNQIKSSLKRIHQSFRLQPLNGDFKINQPLAIPSQQISQFFQKSKLYTQMNDQTIKLMEKIPKTVDPYYKEKKKQIDDLIQDHKQKCANLIVQMQTYFLQSLQKLFKKHNQMMKIQQKSILDIDLKQKIKTAVHSSNWEQIQRKMKTILDQKLYSLDRRIKWNSNNRIVLMQAS